MSLINDALKKAQKQRTGESPDLHAMPGIGGEPAARIAKRNKPIGFNSLITWIGVGAGGVLVLLVGVFFIVRWFTQRPETPAAPAPVVTTSSHVPEPPPSATPAPPEAPVPVVETKPEIPPPAPEIAKPAAPAPKMDPRAIAHIEALRVAGRLASATDSKALINDRIYRIGDIVEHQLGIKLVDITTLSLTFEDEHGARYTRNF